MHTYDIEYVAEDTVNKTVLVFLKNRDEFLNKWIEEFKNNIHNDYFFYLGTEEYYKVFKQKGRILFFEEENKLCITYKKYN